MEKRNILHIVYEVGIALLALCSVILVFLDLSAVIPITTEPFQTIDRVILILFAIDYFTRFVLSKEKFKFFKANLFDLVAIIPLNELFSLFRMARLFRLTKLVRLSKAAKATRLIRAVGFIGLLKNRCEKFLKTNGLIYMIYSSLGLILSCSVIMTFVEGGTFADNLWWSIVTCTTVGYGDISPKTGAGRIVAVVLMVFGIGFIGMLTGAITTYFTKQSNDSTNDQKDYSSLLNAAKSLDEQQLQDLVNVASLMKSNMLAVSIKGNENIKEETHV